MLIPAFTDVVKRLNEIIKSLGALSDEQKNSIVKWGLVAAAIGPVIWTIGKITSGLIALKAAATWFVVTLAPFLLANPVVAVIAGIAAAITAVYLNFDTLVKTAEKGLNRLANAVWRFQNMLPEGSLLRAGKTDADLERALSQNEAEYLRIEGKQAAGDVRGRTKYDEAAAFEQQFLLAGAGAGGGGVTMQTSNTFNITGTANMDEKKLAREVDRLAQRRDRETAARIRRERKGR
ncbi:hypothetical protein HWQ67_05265 [Candidatus Magnetobacterium casensis]|uniref:Uncharacterized protein n=1 Tax=Candidatus Magnetobacterium casense TaxID=1455061 RepID=A0ABS6RWI3_9BACT|nr:hypothetical protein [Candidatus Magnetobacterium casensis]